MKSVFTLLMAFIAAALVVTFSGITPGFHGNVAKAQTDGSGSMPMAGATQAPGTAATPSPTPTGNIIQTLTANGQFTQALAAIQAAGLTQTLESGGPYTVFAPTDTAFAKVPPAQLQAVLAAPGQLQQVLSYHVVPGELSSAELKGSNSVTTLEGAQLTVTTENGVLKVGNATVTQPDIYATNGVIQAIDTVLTPPGVGATPTPTGSPATPGTTP